MKRSTLGAATLAAVLVAGLFVLPGFGDPTPTARGEPRSEITDLRGRGQHVATSATQTRQLRVIDGDTFQDVAANITYRIENIDTPETGPRAHCAAERELGNLATRAARDLLLNAADLDIRPTGRIDRYQRSIAFVVIDGRDFGETLIAEGLARPWRGRREPWCDAGGNLIP